MEVELETFAYWEALAEQCSTPFSKYGDAFWERTPDNPTASPINPTSSRPAVPIQAGRLDDEFTAKFNQMCIIDSHYYRLHCAIHGLLERLSSLEYEETPGVIQCLGDQAISLGNYLQELMDINVFGSDACASYQKVLELKLSETACQIKEAQAILANRLPYSSRALKINIDDFAPPKLHEKDPRTLLAAFMVVVLNIFAALQYSWSNVALRLVRLLLEVTMADQTGQCSPSDEDLLKHFPRDIRTARTVFGMDADIETWAACPRCHFTYPPSAYVLKCTNRSFGLECQATVCKSRVVNKESVLHPLRPFEIQKFESFKARLLSLPHIEELLDRGSTCFSQHPDLLDCHMVDLKDGTGVYRVKGPNGKPFWDGLRCSELQLLWVLSVDWFNPFMNKAAGRSVSVGSIAMVLINLPPSLRYQQGYMFLAGLVPTPKEPPLEAINYYLRPIVDAFKRSWKDGTHHSRTPSHPHGRSERSAIALCVFDMPGGRKVTGHAGHSSSTCPCDLCRLPKAEINNLDWNDWPPRHCKVDREYAEKWRDASSKAERKRIFKESGIRWSILWELEYFDPTTMVVVDSMHNLFLGLVHHHFRRVIGITDEDLPSVHDKPVDIRQLTEVEALLRKEGLSKTQLSRQTRVNVLKALCAQYGVEIGKSNKDELIIKLQALFRQQTMPDVGPLSVHEPVDLIGDEFFETQQARRPADHEGQWADRLSKAELVQLHSYLGQTTRPTWHRAPPDNVGSKGAGKLKADQWRSGIEFDFVIPVARFYSPGNCPFPKDSVEGKRRTKLFESTVYLALAVFWGTSSSVSERHAHKYMMYMFLHLQTLLELYPNMQLTPNQHTALHIGQFLISFGPVHGWWMFPFERLIGRLQQIPTNSKMGELEGTIMRSFCRASNFKTYLESNNCAPILRRAHPILNMIWKKDTQQSVTSRTTYPSLTLEVVRKALEAANNILDSQHQLALRGETVSGITVNGLHFTIKSELERDSAVFFQPLGGSRLVPGYIEQISIAESGRHWLAIRRLKPLRSPVKDNPFDRMGEADFSELDVEFWSDKMSEAVNIIPTTHQLYHSISQPWSKGVRILRCLKRDVRV